MPVDIIQKEPVHDVDIEEDITSHEVKKRPTDRSASGPGGVGKKMMRLTTAPHRCWLCWTKG